MKIYQVCREYYDYPDSTIIKTFLSEEKAEIFRSEYLKSQKWKNNHGTTECMVINEYEVEDIPLEQEPFINKPCVSSEVCEHDKQKVLEKIRAEIVQKHLSIVEQNDFQSGRTYAYEEVLDIIDKYKAESEG